jgi:hypothetical protein
MIKCLNVLDARRKHEDITFLFDIAATTFYFSISLHLYFISLLISPKVQSRSFGHKNSRPVLSRLLFESLAQLPSLTLPVCHSVSMLSLPAEYRTGHLLNQD